MGGKFAETFNSDVTHLILKQVGSEKHRAAIHSKIQKIVQPNWIFIRIAVKTTIPVISCCQIGAFFFFFFWINFWSNSFFVN